jgi:L-alanine-DL-glutamate epimerase-like enolase superfamily enzyme
MRITAVRITPFRDGSSSPARAGPPSGPDRCLVELLAGAALSGSAIAPSGAAAAAAAIASDLLVGEDPSAAMGLWERTGRAASPDDRASVFARAALDVAAWDLKARANGEPLWKTLGGSRPRANAHLHRESREEGGQRLLGWYRGRSAETGIRSGSWPAGSNPEQDMQALETLQQALGATVPQSALMVHFDGSGPPEDAIRHIRRLEARFDLAWVRSPVAPDDVEGARLVADSVAAAVCMGRGVTDARTYRAYLERYAANLLELDLAVSGVSGILQLADAAFGFELPVALSPYPGHVAVQLWSALPNAMSVAIDEECSGEVVHSTVTFENGRAVAGEEPGNGLVIDGDALQARMSGTAS